MRHLAFPSLLLFSIILAANAMAESNVAQIGDLDTQVGLRASHTRWFTDFEYEGEKSGQVFETTAATLSPYYEFQGLGLVLGLPIEHAVQKHEFLSSTEPAVTIRRTTYTPQIAYRLSHVTFGLGYQGIQESGEWWGVGDRMVDYDLAASRTHVGMTLTIGSAQVGLAYANRVGVRKEVKDVVDTPTSQGTATDVVEIEHAPRTTLQGRFPFHTAHALVAVLDYTAMTQKEKESFYGTKNKRGVEDSLGARLTLASNLSSQMQLDSSLKYEGPHRIDLWESSGLTYAYGAELELKVRPLPSLSVSGALGYMVGEDEIAFDSQEYDDDGNAVGTKARKMGLSSTKASYGLAVDYLF